VLAESTWRQKQLPKLVWFGLEILHSAWIKWIASGRWFCWAPAACS
jgi:hypothetical protein